MFSPLKEYIYSEEKEWNVAPLWIKPRHFVICKSVSCKQALCPDEILSSYYLNLNARSFVKWLGLRSPNRNKFSRVAKHNRKINSSLFCIGRHKLLFFLIARRHTFWLNRFIFFPQRLETASFRKQYLID